MKTASILLAIASYGMSAAAELCRPTLRDAQGVLRTYDLSPLHHLPGEHDFLKLSYSDITRYEGYINLCGETARCPGQASCQHNLGLDTWVGCGATHTQKFSALPPGVGPRGVTVTYTGGLRVNNNLDKQRQTTVHVVCDQTAVPGVVSSIREPAVGEYTVVVRSVAGCYVASPYSEDANSLLPPAPACTVVVPGNGKTMLFDTTSLYREATGHDIVLQERTVDWFLNFCGETNTAGLHVQGNTWYNSNCAGNAFCQECDGEKAFYGLGSLTTQRWSLTSGGFTTVYENGTLCPNMKPRRSTLNLVCDTYANPSLVSVRELSVCDYVAEVRAKAACGLPVPPALSAKVELFADSATSTPLLANPTVYAGQTIFAKVQVWPESGQCNYNHVQPTAVWLHPGDAAAIFRAVELTDAVSTARSEICVTVLAVKLQVDASVVGVAGETKAQLAFDMVAGATQTTQKLPVLVVPVSIHPSSEWDSHNAAASTSSVWVGLVSLCISTIAVLRIS